jgi:DNA-binding IclR family transcriptional regulator
MENPRLNGAVDKALLVLQRLGDVGEEGRALSRLAADLGLNKASLHHTLSALRHRGFVEQNSKGNYRLGRTSLALAASYLQEDSLWLMQGALKMLSLKIDESCHLATLVGEDISYIHKVLPKTRINDWSTVGFRNPALTTALGRAIACRQYLDFESFATAFPTPTPKRTQYTLTSLKDIWLELVEARQRGFAREIDEYSVGIGCLAVAVLRGHNPIAAISIAGPTERLDRQYEQFLLRALRECVVPNLPPGLSLQSPVH